MKSVNYITIGMGILIGTIIFSGQAAQAAVTQTEDTTADFVLEAGDTSVPDILDPGVEPPTLEPGPFSLDVVSSFVFETKKIGKEAANPITATAKEGTKIGYQVTDNRGADIGWNLKVKATPFKTGDAKTELKGAAIHVPKGQLITAAGVDPLLAPTTNSLTLSETPATIMHASSTQGRSSWLNLVEGNGETVTLTVPTGNKAAAYVSTMTWTLEDAP